MAHSHTIGNLEERQGYINRVAAQLRKDGHTDPSRAIQQHTYATKHRSLMHVGGRVNALDRDNIGTVENLIDSTGQANVRFLSSDGERTWTKVIDWEEIRPVDHLLHHAAKMSCLHMDRVPAFYTSLRLPTT